MITSDPHDEAEDGKPRAGRLLNACRIDLPPDDVIEEIEYERFFRLNLIYGDLQGPIVINLVGPDEAAAEAPHIGHVPLSDDPADWDRVSRGMPGRVMIAAAAAAAGPVDIRSLPLAIYMPFTQQWKLGGYTRGRVVNSFTLGPSEEQTVEVFTWDRLRTGFESTDSFDSEQNTESSGSRRDAVDVSRDVAQQSGFEMTSGGKVGFTVGVVNADITAGMTARTGVNSAEKQTRNSIVEATSRSTNRVRTSRTLKVTESRESGREERVTRKLRNPNLCHTLTVPFFEVLANYRVTTYVRAEDVRLTVLIPSSQLTRLRGFDRNAIRVHETALRLALLDRSLEPGFAAARLLDARDRACAILCEGCSCGDDEASNAGSIEWNAVAAAARAVADAVALIRGTPILFPLSVPGAIIADATSVADIKRYLFSRALAAHAPRLLTDLAAVGIPPGTTQPGAGQVEAMHRVLAALSADAVAGLAHDDSVGTAVYWQIQAIVFSTITHELISSFAVTAVIKANTGNLDTYDDRGLLGAIGAFTVAYDAWAKAQAEERLRDEKRAELARIAREERQLRVLESYGLRETADAEERLQALLDHLNDERNIDHYRFAVWNERSGGADDAVIALALGGLIDPTPVGIVGDQLAVPVRLEREPRLQAFFTDSVADLIEATVRDERRHILPTAALYAEAVVGQCCACEKETRDRRTEENRRLVLDNRLLALEADRLEARLAAHPPLLDKDLPPAARIDVTVGDPPAGTA
ncbi:hypothetical protein OG885_00800 [Streptomyces sp. NBC_00028]|uniref:hypothetical protein n=1 Tax=Streptomyces sp. NBC_00028 TaxID=2975624 RepID=UPI003246BE08